MPGTRSSARLAEKNSSPPAANDNKRKADDSQSSPSKRGRKNAGEQKTLEETLKPQSSGTEEDTEPKTSDSKDNTEQNGNAEQQSSEQQPSTQDNDADMKDAKISEPGESWRGETKEGESKSDPEKALKDSRTGQGLNTLDVDKPQLEKPIHDDVHADAAKDPSLATKGGAVTQSEDRANQMPTNILEKGIIYFFTRGRVGIDDPSSVQDLQRSYFVLRPLPQGAKLGEGAIEDLKNNRMIALPKKVFPKSPKDRFMVFVEKAKTTIDDLKENFFQGSEYQTKTAGTREQPPVTPIGEGVYAITSTGARNESHLAYMLTIPREPGEMQNDVGVRAKGSFVMSLKNPTVKGPAYASLDQGPEFPQDIIDEFSNRSWMPAQPKHLDFANAQFLLIGESLDDSHALEATSKDQKADDKETPQEEMEKLEHEDELRVEHLKGDDTVFDDLGLSHNEYPSVPTTW